jgi:hypothetical protein
MTLPICCPAMDADITLAIPRDRSYTKSLTGVPLSAISMFYRKRNDLQSDFFEMPKQLRCFAVIDGSTVLPSGGKSSQ